MTPWLSDSDADVYLGDCRKVLAELPDGCAACCVTSPPYLDARPEYPTLTPAEFGSVFRELRRVVTGPVLLNVGRLWRDGKELLWWERLLREAERYELDLIDTLVWIKPNANPIHGRVFANSHEYVFVLDRAGTKLDVTEIRTEYTEESVARMARTWRNGRGVKGDNRDDQESRDLHSDGARPRSYLKVYVGEEKGNEHPAPMPRLLAAHLIRLGAREGETVIDPFAGSGTTALVCRHLGRRSISVELKFEYAEMIAVRLQQLSLLG